MKPITHLFVAGLLLLAFSAAGQPLVTTFSPSTVNVAAGAPVDLQLKVQNFTNITSVQFSIAYNNVALTYNSTDGFTLPGMTSANLNSIPAQGKITVSWFPDFGIYPNGVTVNDNTAIFTLHFTAVADGSSLVNLSTMPLNVEITRNFSTVTVNYQNGGSNVTVGTGQPPVLPGFKIIPNTIYIPKDSTRCMPVTVHDFDCIAAMQYAMHWDKTVLQYVNTKAWNLPDLNGGNFVANQNTGTVILAWYDNTNNPPGVTRADGTKIYEVCFKGIGNAGTSSLITVDGVGFPPGTGSAEAYNCNSQNVWSNTPGNLSGVTDTVFVVAPPPPPINVIFTADKDTVLVGGQTCVDVKATNFDDIISAQFAVTYNATQLQYQSIQLGANPLSLSGPVLPGCSSGNFNACTPGQISFIWDDPVAQGVTLANNTTIFSVCFTAAAPAGTTAAVTLGAAPGFSVEIIRDPNVPLTPTMNSGHVYIKAGPTATLSFTNATQPTCNGGATGTLTATVQNGTPNNYTWSGPAGFVSVNQAALTGLKSGVYSVTVTLQGGSTLTGNYDLPQPPAITLPTSNATPVNCNGGSDGAIAITAQGGTGTLSYAWTGPSYTSSSEDITGLKAGNYTVVVTDANGCSLTSSPILVSQPNAITLPTNNLVVTDVTCFNGTNGSINISPMGGTMPYTFAWGGPNGPAGNNEDLVNVGPGLYTVSITDAHNCPTFVSQSISVQNPPAGALNVSASNVQNVKCFGELSGSATANAGGGWGSYTYLWKDQNGNTVSLAPTASALGPGAYNVTVTDLKGCTVNLAVPVFIQGPGAPMTSTPETTPAACGVQNGTINLNVAGGYGNYNYNWSPTVPDTNNVPAGTYTVTITDAGGCSHTESVTVGGSPGIASGTPIISHVSCASAGDGCITLALSGGTPNYTVLWSNGQSGQSICGLSGGTYTPTITDAANCTLVLAPITVNEAPPLSINPTIVSQNGAVGGSIDLNFTGGVGPYLFQWEGPGNYQNTTNVDVISDLDAGDYDLTITDNAGCQLVQTITVGSANPLDQTTVLDVIASCGNNGCIILSIPAIAQQPFIVSWNGGNQQAFDSHEPSICGLSPGFYTITVTDASNNTYTVPTQNVGSLQPALASSVSNPPVEAFANGSIMMTSAIPGVTMIYNWSDGPDGPLRINLDSGCYVVTITNPISQCTAVQTFCLERQYQAISITSPTINNTTCAYSANGSINITADGGAEPLSFLWSGPNGFTATTEDISGLGAGIYFVTVTDIRDTVKVAGPYQIVAQSNLAVTNVNELSIYPGGYQVSGPNECDGEASVAISGGIGVLNVQWSNGASGISTTTLCGGPYSVMVTDGLGCTASWSDELSAPAPILATGLALSNYNGYNVKCNGSCDGAARVSVNSGGVGPFIFQWPVSVPFNLINSGAEYSQASGLCGGDYHITITDANGNTIVQTVSLTEPDAITVSFINQAASEGFCDGQIIVEPNGAIGAVEYEWTGNRGHEGTGSIASGLCAGEVVLFQMIDENGCEASAQDTVEYPISSCFSISQVITPNNDGDNDFLKILCIELSPDNAIEIYNRWGQLVFTVKGYVNNDQTRAWYGTSNGEPLAEGVYFYVLTYTDPVSGDPVQKKGYVNLLR